MQYNEVHKETALTLQEINNQVAAVQESQEKMWRAIGGMSKELQDLAQGDADTDVGKGCRDGANE